MVFLYYEHCVYLENNFVEVIYKMNVVYTKFILNFVPFNDIFFFFFIYFDEYRTLKKFNNNFFISESWNINYKDVIYRLIKRL